MCALCQYHKMTPRCDHGIAKTQEDVRLRPRAHYAAFANRTDVCRQNSCPRKELCKEGAALGGEIGRKKGPYVKTGRSASSRQFRQSLTKNNQCWENSIEFRGITQSSAARPAGPHGRSRSRQSTTSLKSRPDRAGSAEARCYLELFGSVSFVRVASMSKTCYKHDQLVFVNCIEQSVVPESVSVVLRESSLQSLNVWSEMRIFPKQRVHILFDLPIHSLVFDVLLELFSERIRFGDPIPSRQSCIVRPRCQLSPFSVRQ